MRTCLVVVVFLLSVMGAFAQAPTSLEQLRQLTDDKDVFTSAVREFDKAQLNQAKTALEEADKLRLEGKAEEAAAKQAQAQELLDLVRKAYEFGLEQFSDSAMLHNYYGELLYDFYGEHIKAVTEWERALQLDDTLAAAHNNLGLHHFHNGSYPTGLHYMEQAIKLDKNNPDFLFNMAQIYLIHWPQIQKLRGHSEKKIYRDAMKMSEKATKLSPDDYSLHQDYAVNFFAAERFQQAADWKKAALAWQKARPLARTNDEQFFTWLNEARVWIEAGDKEQARACLDEALKLRPDSDVAKNLLAKTEAPTE